MSRSRSDGRVTPALSQSEVKRLNDPNFLVELVMGPPNPSPAPQKPGTGLQLGGQYSPGPRSFVFKKAHLSFEDNRIFDEAGEIVLVTHPLGKNPYGARDPLGLVPLGEWDSICNATGYNGMPSFKVRPSSFSIHGRQYVQDPNGKVTYFNLAKQSRIKSMSLRHSLLVCSGDRKKVVYRLLPDLTGRSIQLVNQRDELEAIVTESTNGKNLILSAAFNAGSELQIDVAPGVDWTAILAVLIAMKQVGKNRAKDAVDKIIGDNSAATDSNDIAIGADGVGDTQTEVGGVADSVSAGGETVAQVGQVCGHVILGFSELLSFL